LRRIPLSRRSHITGFQPLPTGTAEHESALERDFVARTSLLDPAASIISQPVTLRFRDGSKTRRYTPDFLVRGSNGRSRLIEVKYRAELQLRWDQYRSPFAAARDWAREQGAIFRIATERHIRDTALDNAKRLLPLRRAPCDSEAAALLLAVIRDQKAPTFEGVLAALPISRQAALSTLWRLIAYGAVRVDLRAPIKLDTPLSLP
jgi:TnsA endonuclease N terminal